MQTLWGAGLLYLRGLPNHEKGFDLKGSKVGGWEKGKSVKRKVRGDVLYNQGNERSSRREGHPAQDVIALTGRSTLNSASRGKNGRCSRNRSIV